MLSAELLFHLASAIIGDILLLVTGIIACLYLVHNRLLKNKRFMPLSSRFPSINKLDRIGINLLSIAFIFMTLGALSGAFLASRLWGPWWFLDPRQIWSMLIWCVLAVMLYARLTKGWRGRRAAWFTVLAVILALGGFYIVSNLPLSQHQDSYGTGL